MFRNPRENAHVPPDRRINPSVGRPPSPPRTLQTSDRLPGSSNRDPTAMNASQNKPGRMKPTQTASKPRQTTLNFTNGARKSTGSGAGTGAVGSNKSQHKPNGKILDFFKKAEEREFGGLFVEEKRSSFALDRPISNDDGLFDEDDTCYDDGQEPFERFNELGGSVKRRKTGGEIQDRACTPPPPDVDDMQPVVDSNPSPGIQSVSKPSRYVGPFFGDSESDEDEEFGKSNVQELRLPETRRTGKNDTIGTDIMEERQLEEAEHTTVASGVPCLNQESTSYLEDSIFDEFENMEDFEDDIEEGEENIERRYMKEQRRLEIAEGGFEGDVGSFEDDLPVIPPETESAESALNIPSCPICGIELSGVSDNDASIHVNNCLDGKPTPLNRGEPANEVNSHDTPSGPPFKRPARAPKPGQANPFTLGDSSGAQSSAFAKLMSGHAEDAAWSTAARSEAAARGKPSFQRTCPFYKILPGFFICVDAFRYGAVKDCHAYFLSHFHSDHYIGLTSNWCHGPIYCSRVTANLVRQQLRVDPKWVVDLEYEKKVEVSNTQNVHVTMIPANHCPGSSLFLFEKVIGNGKHPRTQRVLHCGDFRACQAHIEHPLLRPDALNELGEKIGQQKIDVCYLDTTYLNPKYAFPSQEEVIKACADMCVSLSKDRVDETDEWEMVKRERAGEGMAKFMRRSSDSTKQEEQEDGVEATAVQRTGSGKGRGRLLVVVGTYSIGKERMCLGIARALNSKIYAPPGKQRICACLEDPELNARLTADPREAQVHMTPLFEIRAETLDEYLKDHSAHFSRAIGFRPTGWNYRPPNSRFVESPAVQTVLHSPNWKSNYTMKDLHPQRGSTSRASCFGVPYSEHSSFRELTMFCCALRIDRIIPTVNVGSAKGREKMKSWIEKWAMERKRNGLFRVENGASW